ncbi:MAG: sigma-70 family RNA polymerase sigma factor [Pseudomonadales bacterium]|jgi:RNA polymerase sigma-70 factor (ECF subfamily)|nr:sigma-70 family RNA polymerase sigma factor [Pseudomonadales bacterium]
MGDAGSEPDAEPDAEDARLVAAWQGGDEAAFEALYARWSRPVWRFLAARAGRGAADELHQETWLAVIRGRDGYTDRARFPAWLFTLARNAAIDGQRRRAVRPDQDAGAADVETLTYEEDAAAQVDGERRARDLRAAVAALPLAQRETVLLRWEAGLTLPEIAEHTGAPLDTVKSRLRYALARLREEVPAHGG